MLHSVVLLVSREDIEGLKIKYFPEMLDEKINWKLNIKNL